MSLRAVNCDRKENLVCKCAELGVVTCEEEPADIGEGILAGVENARFNFGVGARANGGVDGAKGTERGEIEPKKENFSSNV